MAKRKRKVKFTKYEIVLFVITFAICAMYPFASVYAKSALSEINYEVEVEAEEFPREPTFWQKFLHVFGWQAQ